MTTPRGVDWSQGPLPDIYDRRPGFRRVLRSYRLAWCVAAVAVAVAVYLGFFRGEWHPTGDGRTVVHSRTGEIRNVPPAP